MNRPTHDFLRSLSIAASSRLHAAQRLTDIDSKITLLNVFMVFCIIVLTMFPKFVGMHLGQRNWFEMMTIVLAILLLSLILLQFSTKSALKSEQFQRSGLEIQEIRRFVQFKGFNVSEREFQELSKRFEDILHRYSLKHDMVDIFSARLEHPEYFPLSPVETRIMRFRIWLASAYPIVMIAVISLLVTMLLTSTV